MSFALPWLLLLLLLVAAAAVWLFYRLSAHQASWIFPGSQKLWAQAPSLKSKMAALLSPILKIAALVLVVLGLARPQKVLSQIRGLGQGFDIMLAMDTSTSMSSVDFEPSRLEAAKATALHFIQGRTQDRIGAIQFGGAPELICPLTLDYGALISQLSQLYPGMTQTDGTAIGDGIISAVNHLKESKAKTKIIILLTDGRSNTGIIDPITAAKAAAAEGIKIYTIGCAKKGQAMMPITNQFGQKQLVPIDDDLDEDLLGQIASITDGQFFRAQNTKELEGIYATIDKLEKSEVKLPPILSRADLYQYPVTGAVLLLILDAILSNTMFLRWP